MDNYDFTYVPRSDKDIIADILNEAQDDFVNTVDKPSPEPKFADEIVNLGNTEEIAKQIKGKFCSSIKPALLSMALQKVLGKCFSKGIHEDAKAISINLVNNFIEENGVETLLSNFRKNSMFLAEMAMIIDKYYEKIVYESADDDDEDNTEYFIDPDTKEDFYKDIKNIEDEEVVFAIQNRVSDAISQFINKNTEQKLEIKNILDDTVSKVNPVQTNAELDAEAEEDEEIDVPEDELEESFMYDDSYTSMNRINDVKRSKASNVFEKMVYNMTSRVIKNEYMHEAYMKNNRPNMDAIIEGCEVLYTFLEFVNTTKMIDIDEEYIRNVINE